MTDRAEWRAQVSAAADYRAGDLWEHATPTVFSEGLVPAAVTTVVSELARRGA